MKIACVTTYNALNPNGYGVRAYYMIQALQKLIESVEYIGSLKTPDKYSSISLILRAKMHLYYRILKKDYSYARDPLLLKEYAKQISKNLENTPVDLILSPISPASQPVAYLDCVQPIVIWTDTTFAGALDFYPGLSRHRLCAETIQDGIANEKAALDRASLVIFSSEWAAEEALRKYQMNPSKVKVVPFGANIECDRDLCDIQTIIDSRPSTRCKLLFLGEDWDRKGGAIAVKVAEQLNKAGLNTELTVVGCIPTSISPDSESFSKVVTVLGYLSKATEQGANKISELLAESHFLILPTTADCTPFVIPEANSFGTPCLTTAVGGIPTMIRKGINGQIFSKEADIDEYSQYILTLFANYNQYKQLAASSFNEYQARLNWSVNTQMVKNLMMEL
jgi:glycosyltransferase involved in cell wall biosynthesis